MKSRKRESVKNPYENKKASFIIGGPHSRGCTFKNISFREGALSRRALFRGGGLFREGGGQFEYLRYLIVKSVCMNSN